MADSIDALIKDFENSRVARVGTATKVRNYSGKIMHSLFYNFGKWGSIGGGIATLAGAGCLFSGIGAPLAAPLLTYGIPSLCLGQAYHHTWAKKIEKPAIAFLMNNEVRRAGMFASHMNAKGIDAATREAAVQRYLKKRAPLGISKEYFKNMPGAAAQIAKQTFQNKSTHRLPLWYVGKFQFMEEHLETLLKNHKIGGNIRDGFKNIIPFTRQNRLYRSLEKQANQMAAVSWNEYQALRKTASASVKDAGAAIKSTPAAGVQLKQVLAQKSVAAKPVQAVEKAMPAVVQKTAENGAKRLPISAKLMKQIGSETLKKTGAKIAGVTAIKVGAKKIPILGAVFGTVFAAGRALKGDWTGAGLEFCSGAASCAPGVGTAASLTIDGALLARDLAGSR